jgi:hypothetical protein
MELDYITKTIGAVTATMALVTGGYTLSDKIGLFKKPILTWAPEHFKITGAPANGDFKVIVAREKHRDDCAVKDFKLEIRDSEMVVHPAKSSVSTFSGPAAPKIDKFGYTVTIPEPAKVAAGKATLLATILYKCPEGEVIVNYPDHENLTFDITKSAAYHRR